jgi:hypothetical protein
VDWQKKMVFPFTRDEVRGHLKDLGLKDVSEAKLDEFMHNLKRLVRYDEKQQRLRNEGKKAIKSKTFRTILKNISVLYFTPILEKTECLNTMLRIMIRWQSVIEMGWNYIENLLFIWKESEKKRHHGSSSAPTLTSRIRGRAYEDDEESIVQHHRENRLYRHDRRTVTYRLKTSETWWYIVNISEISVKSVTCKV